MSRAVSSVSSAWRDVNVAGEDRAVGAVLDFDPVGGDVDRRVAVVTLERRDRLLLRLAGRRARRQRRPGEKRCKDDANGAHSHHLTAP